MKYIVSLLLLALFATAATAQGSIKCYECSGDCNDFNEDYLKICGPDDDITTESTTSTDSTGTASTATTAEPGTTATATTPDAGTASTPTTAEPGTTATATTPDAGTASTPTTTEPGTTATATTTDAGTASTPTTAEPGTTATATTTDAGTASTPTTTEPGTTATTTTLNPVTTSSISPEVPTNAPPAAPGTQLSRLLYRSRRETITYACYTVNVKDDDKIVVQRGCARTPTDKNACDVIKADVNNVADPADCQVCFTDGCNRNGSSTLQISMATVLILSVLKYLF